MGKEILAGDHSNDTHVSLSLVRLRHRAVLPRVRQGLRTGPALRLRGVLRPARGPLRLPGRDPVRHRGGPAEHVAAPAASPRPAPPPVPAPPPAPAGPASPPPPPRAPARPAPAWG